MNNYVPGKGPDQTALMLVGEAPGGNEVSMGYPFAGPTGDMVKECCDIAGFPFDQTYRTNVCKVRPPDNDIEKIGLIGHSIEEFLPELWDEITRVNPNCILAIGNTALRYLTGYTGIKNYRGSILPCIKTGHKVVATLHPASLLHQSGSSEVASWKEYAYIKQDFKRAVEQAEFFDIRIPQRNLWFARNSLDVIRFLEKYQHCDRVTLDVETYKTYAQCIGLAFNSYEACSIPTFWDQIPDHDLAYIWKSLCEFLADTKIKIIAQNAKFDEKRSRQLGLRWHDCWMDMGMGWHVLYSEFPKSLQFITSVLTDEPYYKDEGKEYDPKKHKIDRWFLYNAKDAAVEFECTEKILEMLKEFDLQDFFFDKIMPLHRLYSDMEDVGLAIDLEVNRYLKKKYSDLRDAGQKRLITLIADGNAEVAELYKNFNVMSNGPKNQVAKLIYGFLKCPVRKDTSDETLKSLVNNSIKDQRRKDILLGILEVRKLRKTIGTYLDAEPSSDGRIHSQFNINGTESGRTSSGILKPPVSVYKEGIAFQTMTKHEDVTLKAGGGDLRAEFVADDGWTLIEPDLSQAEDRVVCVLAEDWDALESYKRTEFKFNKYGLKDDRHTLTAMYVCELGFDSITDWERQVGKKTRHSGNYNVGKHQHMLTLGKSGIFVSEWKAGRQLEKFHAENPRIRNVFHQSIVQALRDNDCRLFSPHGRLRQFFNKWGEDLFKEAYAQIPQATVSDQVKFAMTPIKKRMPRGTFYYAGESHDSFLALCRNDCVDKALPIIKEELEMPIDFNKCTLSRNYQLVIPAEVKIGKRWIEKSDEWPDGLRKVKV